MTDGTDENAGFGASDLGGPRHASPSQAMAPDAGLTNESIKRMAWSRWFAFGALFVMSASAIGCLGFAMYVGCHFLGAYDKHQEFMSKSPPAVQQALAVASQPALKASPKDVKQSKTDSILQAETQNKTDSAGNEKLYFMMLAPLIPASFSSALAIILFITIARFVTNFVRIGKESTEKDTPEDYGAIAVLVQEIGKLIKTMRGK
jgi:hypothetical protein